uniref:Uncharacterized protein n=1 Tax=Anguilla anguilla TaxID=7936 RepID=A0A0E9RB76_ANGAN
MYNLMKNPRANQKWNVTR